MRDSKGLWFLAGLGLGAVVGILYAPRSGEETRDLIGRKALESRQRVIDKAAGLKQQASDFAERGRSAVTRQIDQFQAAVEAGRQAYRDAAASAEDDNRSGTRGL